MSFLLDAERLDGEPHDFGGVAAIPPDLDDLPRNHLCDRVIAVHEVKGV
jgi:hypothetical protein